MHNDEVCLSDATIELRRRFVNALRDEDAITAHRAYKCSFEGLILWKREEEDERLSIQAEQIRAQQESERKINDDRTKLKKLRNLFKSDQDEHSVETMLQSNRTRSTSSLSILSKSSNKCPIRKLFKKQNQLNTCKLVHVELQGTEVENEEIRTHNDNSIFENGESVLGELLHPSSSLNLYEDEFNARKSKKRDKYIIRSRISKIKTKQPQINQAFHQLYSHSFGNLNPISNSKLPLHDFFKSHSKSHSRMIDEKVCIQNESAAMTTPLHEAARLGNLELIKGLLMDGGDPNERDGLRRSALHLVCGGLTRVEETVYVSQNEFNEDVEHEIEDAERDIGIRLYVPSLTFEDKKKKKRNTIKHLFKKIGRNKSMNESLNKTPKNDSILPTSTRKTQSEEESIKIRKEYERERMECLWALLTYSSNPPMLNSVDGRGRTALHYAAELGRENICSTLLGQDKVILTIIDENSRTPCELAGMHGHKHLAAQLEARALIGGGEDMMVLAGWSMLQEDDFEIGETSFADCGFKELVPPFSWYDTVENIEGIRTNMIEETKDKMEDLLSRMLVKIVQDESAENNETYVPKTNLVAYFEDGVTGDHRMEIDLVSYLSQFQKFTLNQTSKLLASFEWDSTLLLENFEKYPGGTLCHAQVIPLSCHVPQEEDDYICLICRDEFSSESPDWVSLANCGHSFCRECLSDYISSCAKSRDMGILSIPCPHHECSTCMDIGEIEHFTGSIYNQSYKTLLQVENENFVSKARDYTFCPAPSCNGIVQCVMPDDMIEKYGQECSMYLSAVCTRCPRANDTIVRSYEGVLDSNYNSLVEMPRKAHRFCFTCKDKPHWPLTCNMFQEWKQKVAEECHDLESERYEDVAQSLWMRANTRPCPKCNVPIEKVDGCNHMTCTNRSCKHEFCWICRKDWKLHNTKTGGFFRCNRWQEEEDDNLSAEDGRDRNDSIQLVEDHPGLGDEYRYGTSLNSARIARRKNRSMARFLHHYSRWSAHIESATLERKMQDNVCERLAMVVLAASEYGEIGRSGTLGNGLSFIHAAFTELLECRSMLEHTYPFSFYRYDNLPPYPFHMNYPREIEKVKFEVLQSELEMITEQMSDIVARKHLRATMTQIMFLTNAAEEKRRELTMFMIDFRHGLRKKNARERNKQSIIHGIEDQALRNLFPDPARRQIKTSRTQSINIQIDAGNGNTNSLCEHEESVNQEDLEYQLAVQASIRSHLALTNETLNRRTGSNDDSQGWTCPVCTYNNRGGLQCAICGSRMPD